MVSAKERMGVGLGLNLLLLVAMVAANILSLYHLSSLRNSSSPPSPPPSDPIPDHLFHQLHTIRSTIFHLTRLRSAPSSSSLPHPPPELLLHSRISPIASSCSDHLDLLHPYMNYTPFSSCPRHSIAAAESLLLRGCHPLPRRRCFSPTASCLSFSCLPSHLRFDLKSNSFQSGRSALDLPIHQLLAIASAAGAAPIRLGLDIAGGSGSLSAYLKLSVNATVITTTMNLGSPYSEVAAMRGVIPLHAPLQQRLPVHDAAMDLVRTGHAVNRWIPIPVLEFLMFDADRVLKAGGLLWIDHFFCKGRDLEAVYMPLIARLGYKRIKWAIGNKTDSTGMKFGEVYLTALLQKPMQSPLAMA